MQQGFQDRFCNVMTTDFRQFKFTESKDFLDTDGTWYQIPVGGGTDLASVPQTFWTVLPPFGEYALEAALHDCAYQNTLKKKMGDSWVRANLTKNASDDLLKRAMSMNSNITAFEQTAIFRAVSLLGGHAFNEDRGNA